MMNFKEDICDDVISEYALGLICQKVELIDESKLDTFIML